MKIRKFNEKYEIDLDGDIAREYAKLIISEFLDRENDEITLEDIYKENLEDFIEDDDDDFREDIIKAEIIEVLDMLKIQARKIRRLMDIDIQKYNL